MKQRPTYIYKYHPLNIYLMELLTNAEFFLSDRDKLNDPLDSSFTMTYENYENLYYEKYPSLKTAEHQKTLKFLFDFHTDQGDRKFLSELSDLPDGLKIACFTEDGNNPLMWSHYATNHYGVCMKFDLSKDETLRDAIKPVSYLDELVDVKTKSDFEKSSLTKLSQWKSEKEWRIVDDKAKFSFKHKSLVEIVLGLNVPESSVGWIKQLCENIYYSDTAIHRMAIRANRMVKTNSWGDIVDNDFIPVPRKPYEWELNLQNLTL